jgi:predicted metalloprotease
MRWRDRRESENVEDRRAVSGPVVAAGGGIGVVVLAIIVMALGGDPRPLLQQVQQQQQQAPAGGAGGQVDPAQEESRKFVGVILADTEDVWNDLFQKMGKTYEEPKLVLFNGNVQSACGLASRAVGPFYCPGDTNVYLDLSFFDELRSRFRAPGEFAQAYVVAHEVGHHVQNLLGISRKVSAAQRQAGRDEANRLSVRLELQADFLAGVWAHHGEKMKHFLEQGDIETALRAATAIGDDRLQMQAQGYVVPDSFTHGTSEQRLRWFTKGLKTGDIDQGDTFSASDL